MARFLFRGWPLLAPMWVLSVLGTGFLALAEYLALADALSSPAAAALTAVTLLLLAALLAILFAVLNGKGRQKSRSDAVFKLFEAVGGEIGKSGMVVAGAALLAGIAASLHPGTRKILLAVVELAVQELGQRED